MAWKLRIHYNTPEGFKETEFKTEFDGLKEAHEISKRGMNIVRQSDQLYVPPQSIIAISYSKIPD